MKPYYEDERSGIVIYHGDCRVILPELARVDHVITDPPYDVETHKGARTSTNTDAGMAVSRIAIDFDPLDVRSTVPALLAAATRWVIAFCALEMLGTYRQVSGESWIRAGFWRRPDGAPQFTGDRPGQPGEGIAIMHRPGRKRWNGGGHHAFYEIGIVRTDRDHPTQKPEPLMMSLVSQFTDPGDTILDPFAGSFTTLVAAKRLGRKAIGIELEERYCEVAARRLQQDALPLMEEA